MLNLNDIKVALIREQQDVWFIRASSGKYERHFKKGGVIAIKHLEDIFGDDLLDIVPDMQEVKAKALNDSRYYHFKTKNKKEVKELNRAGHAIVGQIGRFCRDIKLGDLIVTKNDSGGYTFGVCSELSPYIDKSPISLIEPGEVASSSRNKATLNYKLRKNIKWGPSVNCEDLPDAVRRATRGQQTVTRLTRHKEKIYHLIYPFFTDGSHLFFSGKIKTENAISALMAGQLFQNVSLAEQLLKSLLSGGDIDPNVLSTLLANGVTPGDFGVTCQAAFMSPGDLWCKIPLSKFADCGPQIIAGVVVILFMTGQISVGDAGTLNHVEVTNTARIASDQDSTQDIFNDKFQSAELSPKLQELSDSAKRNEANLEALKSNQSVDIVKDGLEVSVTEVWTEELENMDYGIRVLQIGKINEGN